MQAQGMAPSVATQACGEDEAYRAVPELAGGHDELPDLLSDDGVSGCGDRLFFPQDSWLDALPAMQGKRVGVGGAHGA